jgi:hypothetical protein
MDDTLPATQAAGRTTTIASANRPLNPTLDPQTWQTIPPSVVKIRTLAISQKPISRSR